jgi:E3 ubiquitin-protein ligase SHPRH
MTMEELLAQMIKKTTVECEDSQRVLFTAMNGMAAIAIIEENWIEAAAKYREALG